MMSKTHITVGIAAAFALTQPETVDGCFCALAGGAVGGIISDIDVKSTPHPKSKDALYGRIAAIAITVVALVADFVLGGGIWKAIEGTSIVQLMLVAVTFFVILLFARLSKHRGFSHSLLLLVLSGLSLFFIYAPLAFCFAAGLLSHLLLDLLNKQPIQMLYPLKRGFCLGLFYADKTSNTVLFIAGLIVAAALLMRFIMVILQ